MFLRSFVRLARRLRTEERGVALAAVIGLMVVGLLLTTLIVSSVTSGLGATTATRAGVQSQAAAEAGIAVAKVAFEAGSCLAQTQPGVFVSATGAVPQYSASVYWRPLSGGAWTQGCPVVLQTQVRIVSTGTAAASGVAGQSAKDVSYAESIYNLIGIGAAVYGYSSTGSTGNGTFVSVDGSAPAFFVRTGDVNCSGSIAGMTDIVVQNGSLTTSGNCTIPGNAWSSGSMSITGSASVGGLAWSLSSITAAPGKIVGARWPYAVTPPAPVAPVVPPWIDFPYDITRWPGFTTVVVLSGSSCSIPTLASTPEIIDARSCTNALNLPGIVSLSNDVVVFANQFAVDHTSISSSTTVPHKLWLITPDSIANSTPDCPGGSSNTFGLGPNFTSDATAAVLIYTPCAINLGSNVSLYGQVFAGIVAMGGGPTVAYVPVGLPGVSMATGSLSYGFALQVVSNRNVQSAG